MWKVISLFWLCWGLAGFSLAETVPSKQTTVSQPLADRGWIVLNRGGFGTTPESGCKSYNSTWVLTGGPLGVNDFLCRNPATGTQSVMYETWGCLHGGGIQNINGTIYCPSYTDSTCPDASFTLSPDKTTCTRTEETTDQLNQKCATAAQSFAGKTFGSAGCQPANGLPSGWGCAVDFTVKVGGTSGGTSSFTMSPYACKVCTDWNDPLCSGGAPSPIDPSTMTGTETPPQQNTPTPTECASNGGTWGQVNGKDVCVQNAPKPGENTLQTSNDGKDANGNCAKGYVGVIDQNNNFVCKQPANPNSGADIVRPLDNNTCPQGYDKVGSYCFSNGKPKGTAGGTGDASSPTSTTPTSGSGNPNDPKKDEEKAEDCKSAFGGVFAAFCPDQNSPPDLDLTTPNLGQSDSVNVSSLLNTTDRLIGSGSCPQPKQVQITLGSATKTLEFTYQPFCDVAGYIRPFLIGLAFISAGFIILRRG